MPSFTYVARSMEGRTVSGVITAESEQQVLHNLEDQSLFPVEVRAGGKSTRAVGGGRKKVSGKIVAVIYSQFADLLRAGVPALRSLDVLSRQTSNVVLREVLNEVKDDLSGGHTLADAMGKHSNVFNPLHVSMIRAGEKGGFLEEVLSRIAAFTERQNELRNKLVGALMYPSILMFVGMAVVTFLLMVVVPKIQAFLRTDLPWVTELVFAAGDFLRGNFLVTLGGVGVGILVVVGIIRSPAGRAAWDKIELKAPLLGKLVTLVAICRFCRILGTLLQNGVPILQSLKISRDSAGNRLLMNAIDDATESVRMGSSLSAPLGKSQLFPLDIIDMIAVGEESNNLDNVLITIADSYEARTARQIDLMVRVLEPLLLVGMAAIVAVIAIALLLPILTMSSSFQ